MSLSSVPRTDLHQIASLEFPGGEPIDRRLILKAALATLSAARLLQKRGGEVTIYAKDLPPATTSNIAGAQWSPYSVFDTDKQTPDIR
jgi:hypothetical protein